MSASLCSAASLAGLFLSNSKFQIFWAALISPGLSEPQLSPFELLVPTCCSTAGLRAHLDPITAGFSLANFSARLSTKPILFSAYQSVKGLTLVVGYTIPCAQHPSVTSWTVGICDLPREISINNVIPSVRTVIAAGKIMNHFCRPRGVFRRRMTITVATKATLGILIGKPFCSSPS